MWRSKKFIVIAVLAVLPVVALLLIGEGCTQAGGSDDSQTETETAVNEMPGRMQPQMPLDEVAKTLGIDQQKLEDAFIQARDELGGGLAARPGEWSPHGPPPGGPPLEGLPGGMGPSGVGPLPEALLAKMAEILNIDQQTLENAFAQVQSTDSGQ